MAFFQDGRADIAKKLNTLSAQGCKVEIITGIHWQKNYYKAPGYKIIELLKNKIIKYEGNLHSKIILIDALIDKKKTKLVLTGSHNLSYYAMYVNDETLLAIKNNKIYASYLKFWNRIKKYSSKKTRIRAIKVDLYHILDYIKKNKIYTNDNFKELLYRSKIYTNIVNKKNISYTIIKKNRYNILKICTKIDKLYCIKKKIYKK